MKLTCAIVDDEPLARELLNTYIQKTTSLELKGIYSSAIEAFQALPDNPVNILFLDIQMPELDGISFAQMVTPPTKIIFTTAFSTYALDGYKVNALDYLLKPISYTDFLTAVNKAIEWFGTRIQIAENTPMQKETENKECIFVKTDYKLRRIDLDKILYIEGLKDYVRIFTDNEERPIMSLTSIKALEEYLPSEHFIRIHRSYIVNKQKIKIIERGRIVFGKTYLPISDTYKQNLQDFIDGFSI